jgi:hypothetical protein
MRQGDSSKNPLFLAAARAVIDRRLTEAEAGAEVDPVLLARAAGIDPDPWQCDVLRSASRQIILNVTRQGGKSTVSSIRGLHAALYKPGSLVLLLAPSYRQSKELFRKVKAAHAALPFARRFTSESSLEVELSNRSRIVALPGKEETIRGFSGVDELIVDEASRVPDQMYQAIRPMLAVSGGQITLLSTPFGKRGFFFQEYEEGDGWHRTKITAYQCPRIPSDWLEQERRAMPEWWFRQEYLCEFVETVDQVFRYDDIMRALDAEIEPLFGSLTQ